MRIQVKAADHNFTVPIPTGLIFSKPSVWLYVRIARRYSARMDDYIPEDAQKHADTVISEIPEEALYAICAELRRIKKKHGSWELVDVESAGGERVKVVL